MIQFLHLVLFISALICFSVTAGDKVLVVTEEWPPYNYTNDNGEIVGSSTKRLRRVLDNLDVDYEIRMMSWTRAYKSARENKNVLIYTIFQEKSRLPHFQWICPFIKTHGVGMYALAERDDIKLHSTEDAKNYILGAVNYGLTHDWLKQQGFVKGKHLDIATDETINIKKLFAKRVDLIIQEEVPFELRMEKLNIPLSKVQKVYSVFDGDKRFGCLAFGKSTSKQLVNKVAKEVANVMNSHN